MHCAVIGDPAEHSLSPAIHTAGYRAVGLDWDYRAVTVSPSELEGFLTTEICDPDWRGFSVTAPHKEAVLGFGEPDHVARLVGGGNTLIPGPTGPTVHNTDVPGFVRAWRSQDLPRPRTAAIIGAGATVRSLLVALAGLEAVEVLLLARSPEKARAAVDLGTALGIGMTVQPLDQPLPARMDLVANTVPAAATVDHARDWVDFADVVFDAIYDPWPTPLGAAASAEQPVLTGLDLLAGQAVDQFLLMTGAELTFDFCRSAAEAELRRRGAVVQQ